jgi:hypothetical protein
MCTQHTCFCVGKGGGEERGLGGGVASQEDAPAAAVVWFGWVPLCAGGCMYVGSSMIPPAVFNI